LAGGKSLGDHFSLDAGPNKFRFLKVSKAAKRIEKLHPRLLLQLFRKSIQIDEKSEVNRWSWLGKARLHSGAYGIGLIWHNCYKILSNYYLE
jgi:hypothetical protein